MNIVYLIIFFILGTLFGSFFTVIGLRLPNHEDFIKTRSHCDSCNHELSLLDMIPILSYIFLKGKCRYCQAKINSLSTYMEFFTGVLFSLSFYVFGFSYELLIALGIVAMLVIISISDLTYFIIPDEVLFFFAIFFIIINLLNNGIQSTAISIGSGILLFGFMYGIMLLGNLLFKKESLGGGDIKLMFVIGLLINPLLGLVVIFIASMLALPISLIILMLKKEKLVPFGPYLLISFMFIYFTRLNLPIIIEFIRSF